MTFAEYRNRELHRLMGAGVSCMSAKNIVMSAKFRAEWEEKEAAARAAVDEKGGAE